MQQSVFDQALRADQQSVALKRGHRLIRRVPISGRPHRQRLPPALTRFMQSIHPFEGTRPKVANTVRRGQRGDMHQQPRRTICSRERGKRWILLFAQGRPSLELSALLTISWASLTMASKWAWSLKLSA